MARVRYTFNGTKYIALSCPLWIKRTTEYHSQNFKATFLYHDFQLFNLKITAWMKLEESVVKKNVALSSEDGTLVVYLVLSGNFSNFQWYFSRILEFLNT